MKKFQKISVAFVSAIALCFLISCGGGGGDSEDPEPPPPPPPTIETDWDSIVWDQGEWQ